MKFSKLVITSVLSLSSSLLFSNNLSLNDCYGVVAPSHMRIPFQSYLKSERAVPHVAIEQKGDSFLLSEKSPGMPLFTPFNMEGPIDAPATCCPELLTLSERAHKQIKVGAFAFIRSKDGKVLMIRKKNRRNNTPGIYYVPGGLFEKEYDRDLIYTVAREVKEETNFNILGSVKAMFAYESIMPLQKVRYHNLMIFYSYHWNKNSSEFVVDLDFLEDHDEICEVKWMIPEEFLEMYEADHKLSTPSMKFLLEQYQFLLAGNQYKPYKFEKKTQPPKRTDNSFL